MSDEFDDIAAEQHASKVFALWDLVPELAPDASVELVVGAAVSASAPLAPG